ncbi:MAG: hypothetical protein V2G42_06340 [bacterium JZ-2024 1]
MNSPASDILYIRYIPVLTTILSAFFGILVLRRYASRPGTLHHLWWGLGILVYGIGTFTESLTTVFGWREPIFRLWYISGALLGGAPLAQGSVYYHLPRRLAHILTICLLSYVAIASFFVWTAPIQEELVEPHRLSGKVFAIPSVRLFSPIVNLYALVFLVGGALFSAIQYWKSHSDFARFAGNLLIAVGALLPAIGGSFTRFGYTEVLYVLEFFGILLIWRGYVLCTFQDHIGRDSTVPDIS